MLNSKQQLIEQLRSNLLQWEGFKPSSNMKEQFGIGEIESAFPHSIFPTGVIHEFVSRVPEQIAATGGFITGLLNTLMHNGSAAIWISTSRMVFPPALYLFGIDPDRIIFIDLYKEKEILWATEEALKCEGVAAVIAEIGTIDFAQARRLQLVAEKSRVTGFIVRTKPERISATPCAVRWEITSLPSVTEDALPGVGYPRWNVELLKVRNGQTGVWKMEWFADHFHTISENTEKTLDKNNRKAI